VPKSDPNNACIRMEAEFLFKVDYIATNKVNINIKLKI
jgi:hypothetical protein